MKKIFTSCMLLAALIGLPQMMMATKYNSWLFFSEQVVSVNVGRTFNLLPLLRWPDNVGQLRWESGDETVVTVDANGVITGVKDNVDSMYTATIYVYYDENEYYYASSNTIEVRVYNELSVADDENIIPVTAQNAGNILGDGSLSYDFATRTLTMNNSQLATGVFYYPEGNDINEPITLNLIGTNVMDSNYLAINNVILTGGGTLSLKGGELTADSIVIDNARVLVDNTYDFSSRTDFVFNVRKMTIRNNGYFRAQISGGLGEYDHVGYVREELMLGEGIGYLNEAVRWIPDVTQENVYYVWKQRPDLFNGAFFAEARGTYNLLRGLLEIGPIHSDELIELPTHIPTDIHFDGTTDNDGKAAVSLGDNDIIVEGTDGYVGLNTPVSLSDEQVDSVMANCQPGDDSFKNLLPGISILLPAGQGTYGFTYDLTGAYRLRVHEAGVMTPRVDLMSSMGITTLSNIVYYNTNPTLVHIYLIADTYAPAPGSRKAKADVADPALKIYSISVTPQGSGTGIDEIKAPANGASQKVMKNGQLLILRDGKIYDLTGKGL